MINVILIILITNNKNMIGGQNVVADVVDFCKLSK